MSASKTAWYVVQTQARAERRAERNLAEQGYHVFMPTMVKTTRHARRVQQVVTPLFPCYVFVALDLTCDRWYPINGTAGVTRLVTAGSLPAQLPSGFVEGIIVAGAAERAPDFQVDDRVRVIDGPFVELIGRVQKLDERGRVEMLLEIMGRAVSVRTSVASLSSQVA